MTVNAFLSTDAGSCSHPAVDPEMFFPQSQWDTALDDALELCRHCPIRTACLEYAMQQPQYGVWGGTTVTQRQQLARQAGRTYNLTKTPDILGGYPARQQPARQAS